MEVQWLWIMMCWSRFEQTYFKFEPEILEADSCGLLRTLEKVNHLSGSVHKIHTQKGGDVSDLLQTLEICTLGFSTEMGTKTSYVFCARSLIPRWFQISQLKCPNTFHEKFITYTTVESPSSHRPLKETRATIASEFSWNQKFIVLSFFRKF